MVPSCNINILNLIEGEFSFLNSSDQNVFAARTVYYVPPPGSHVISGLLPREVISCCNQVLPGPYRKLLAVVIKYYLGPIGPPIRG